MTMKRCLCHHLEQPCCVEWDGRKGKPLEVPTKGNNILDKLFIFSCKRKNVSRGKHIYVYL